MVLSEEFLETHKIICCVSVRQCHLVSYVDFERVSDYADTISS
jgi:imidazole glycerol phosphate synthase subunit HisF